MQDGTAALQKLLLLLLVRTTGLKTSACKHALSKA